MQKTIADTPSFFLHAISPAIAPNKKNAALIGKPKRSGMVRKKINGINPAINKQQDMIVFLFMERNLLLFYIISKFSYINTGRY